MQREYREREKGVEKTEEGLKEILSHGQVQGSQKYIS